MGLPASRDTSASSSVELGTIRQLCNLMFQQRSYLNESIHLILDYLAELHLTVLPIGRLASQRKA